MVATATMFVGFVLGALTVMGVEVLVVIYFIRRLNRKLEERNSKIAQSLASGGVELDFSYPKKQGFVWILEEENIPQTLLAEKLGKQQKRKKEILEVSPIRKYAKLKDQSLFLTDFSGTRTEIPLLDCIVTAVSATSLPSRKWAKRYPIKVESKTSVIFNGNESFYMYLETSWEKDSWCKALRLASCCGKEKLTWFAKLQSEFHSYLTSLSSEYPYFMKPSFGFNPETVSKSIKIDGSSSKVRHFLKKLAKKASKSSTDSKLNWNSPSAQEGKFEKSYSVQESIAARACDPSASRNLAPIDADTDSVDKLTVDEGTLCWNMLLSRLFFDAKTNADISRSLQARIQRTLSNMKTPSYIGEIACTGIDPGTLPPYIHGMRVLPSDMKEVASLEIDIEYCGGMVLYIETRLEVCELDFQESGDVNLDSRSVGELVTSDLLEGFEYLGEQLKLSDGTADRVDRVDEGNPKLDEIKSSMSSVPGSSNLPRWKSILNSLAKQVQQVPLSLVIRLATLRGTLQLHIKPPPSDQIWFGFTTMPEIDFKLESSVGDHKLGSGHIALYLISRFKGAICETMVLPNCENVTIPWMLAEKDDWVPQKAAPFLWIKNQEGFTAPSPVHEPPPSKPSKEASSQEASKVTSTCPERKEGSKANEVEVKEVNELKPNKVEGVHQSSQCLTEHASSWGRANQSNQAAQSGNALQDIRAPLLGNKEEGGGDFQSSSRSMIINEEQNDSSEGPRRIGTRSRIIGLGKKMGEKFEEKRRNIEEKGRHIVERMRGP